MYMRPYKEHVHSDMKCLACEEVFVNSPWGLGACCKSTHKLSMRDHKKTMTMNSQWLDGRFPLL